MSRQLIHLLVILLNFHALCAENITAPDTVIYNNWLDKMEQFRIDTISNTIQLNGNQTNNEAIIYCPSTINTGKWSLRCKMSFNPSSQNYCELFFASKEIILSKTSGYSLVIGKNFDRIELYRHENGLTNLLMKSVDNFLNLASVDIFITVQRDIDGQWELRADLGKGEELMGKIKDETLFQSNYFIIKCTYTSTRSTKFNFSDITGIGTILPSKELPNNNMAKHDIQFTEFMVDPSPMVNLPDVKYIEIYNRSERTIYCGGMSLQLNEKAYKLPTDSIYSHEYLALTSEIGARNLPAKGRVIGMSTFPTLPNTPFTIFLIGADGNTVDGFFYNPALYKGSKSEGGWALEKLEPFRGAAKSPTKMTNDNTPLSSCHTYIKSSLKSDKIAVAYDPFDWSFSENVDGGTPGAQNSQHALNSGTRPTNLLKINYINDTTFKLYFSRELLAGEINPKIVSLPEVRIKSYTYLDSLYNTILITLKASIDTNTVYTIDSLTGFYDGNKNAVELLYPQKFGKPITPIRGTLWINEILFNAQQDGGEFVELFNSSSRMIETTYLRMQYNSGSLLKISDQTESIYPNDYFLLYGQDHSPKNLPQHKAEKITIPMKSFPQLSNEEGRVSLRLTDGALIDSMHYNVAMHHPSIANRQGVSLERGCYQDETSGCWSSGCWSSASSSVDYSTPGSPNSNCQNKYLTDNTKGFYFPSDYFSPNNDGYLDRFEMVRGQGYTQAMVTIKIYNPNGFLLRNVVENSLLQPTEVVVWDGINENGILVEPGIYLVLITGYNYTGETFTIKKGIVVSVN